MRRFALLPLVVVAACASTPDAPPPAPRAEDPRAAELEAEARRRLVAVDEAREPAVTFGEALAAIDSALALERTPGRLVVRARIAHRLDPTSERAREDARAAAAALPDDPSANALLAVCEAQESVATKEEPRVAAERVERACSLVEREGTPRELRAFVSEQATHVAALLNRSNPRRALELIQRAAKLGHPVALANEAKAHDMGYGVPVDRDRAIALAREAARASFTMEERTRGLLVGTDAESRRAARLLAGWLVADARFDEARPALEKGVEAAEDDLSRSEKPDPEVVLALHALGALEARGLGGPVDLAKGRAHLELAAAKARSVPSLVLLGRLDAEAGDETAARERWEQARLRGSPGALAALGAWEDLATLARSQAEALPAARAKDKLFLLRTILFAKAVAKGGGVRVESEKEAHAAVEGAPENMAWARQLRHLAGELSADELQKTMPRFARVPRWRAETELALAGRCLLLADREGAKAHLENVLAAQAILEVEDELAWAALRTLAR